MITFKKYIIDEHKIFEETKHCFMEMASDMQHDDDEDYYDFFGNNPVKDLNCELNRIGYSKNFEIEDLFYFDMSTEFHLYVELYVYIVNNEGDKEQLSKFTVMLDTDGDIVDTFLRQHSDVYKRC